MQDLSQPFTSQIGPIVVPITIQREYDPEKEKMRQYLIEVVVTFYIDLMGICVSEPLSEVLSDIFYGKQTPPAFWSLQYLQEYINSIGLPPNYLEMEDEKWELLETFAY